jgi:hypothetical protein
MTTLTEYTKNKVAFADLELNTAIKKVRQDYKAAEAALKAPMADSDIPADVKREIVSVVGKNTKVEVRFVAWETIPAREVVLQDGTVVEQHAEDVQVYALTIPGTKLKRGYKTFVRVSTKIDAPAHYLNTSTWFMVIPAMWRRVAFMPHSRSCYGTIGAYIQQWTKHSWKKRSGHGSCVSDIHSFERFVR